jgi:hypothetical protein
MTETTSGTLALDAIQRQINRAERDLVDQRTQLDDDDGMAVLFTGNHHDAFPRHLVINPYLSPVEKTTWQVIRLSINDPHRPGATPRRNDIAAMVNCSPPTITSCKTMLRIRGWLTYCRSVRRSGRFVGDIFLLNDEPMSLQSTLDIDGTFVAFLEDQVESKNQRLRVAASEVLQEIRKLTTSDQPTEIQVIGNRFNRMGVGAFDQSKNFALVETPVNDDFSDNPTETRGFDDQSKNFAPDETDQKTIQSKKFAPVEKKIFYSQGSSSSFNNNKNISIAHVHASSQPTSAEIEKIQQEAESMANYLEIQRQGRWGSLDDDVWTQRYLPWLAFEPFKPYVLWLFAGRSNLLPVIWQKIKPLPKHSQELVIYQLLGHAAAWKHGWRQAIRDPVAYLHRLVELQNSNQLYPDEWSLSLKRCRDEGEILNFIDSPEKMAWDRDRGNV